MIEDMLRIDAATSSLDLTAMKISPLGANAPAHLRLFAFASSRLFTKSHVAAIKLYAIQTFQVDWIVRARITSQQLPYTDTMRRNIRSQ